MTSSLLKVPNCFRRRTSHQFNSRIRIGTTVNQVKLQKLLLCRIQQIQLLGRDMRGSEHDQLWNQIEAEIHLHRHKTVIRACRGRKDPNNKTPAPPPPPLEPESVDEEEDAESKARKRRGIGEPRTVVIHKDKTEGLGISITVR